MCMCGAAAAARVGKLFLDSIIFFSDFFRLTKHTSSYDYVSIHPTIHPSYIFNARSHSTSLSFFILKFSSSLESSFLCVFFFLFSFHSNENHLNIIVIFFFASEPTKSLSLLLACLLASHSTTSPRPFFLLLLLLWCYNYSNHMNFLATLHGTFTFSHTIHIIHTKWMDFFPLPAMNGIRITVDAAIIIVVVAAAAEEFMGNDLLSFSLALRMYFSQCLNICRWLILIKAYVGVYLRAKKKKWRIREDHVTMSVRSWITELFTCHFSPLHMYRIYIFSLSLSVQK